MAEDLVGYHFEDGLARIVMCRGDRGNVINQAWNESMLTALARARQDRARVIVLSATGRFFCVGGDVDVMVGAPSLPDVLDHIADSLHRVVSELQRSDAIVVCSVQGAAAGAGFPLVAAADLVVAARSASFTLGYTKVGLSVDGGTSLLVHSIGLHRALRLALLNRRISADEAAALGLVTTVVADEDLGRETDALAHELLSGPAEAQAATKALLRGAAEPAVETALRREALALRSQGAHADAREGTTAFIGKRRPRFAGSVQA
ncbi:enoyl-CoA hydratase/isomerase family protein [Nakamurella leprariae]|uniref:Enoyl-CoA hydratase/isomerase family protein n=1 Tax=Nakamurella leprariae TaxID=2803911 RepID=A0A938YGR0_9ACTN|nr:enoyl-CoA hydratase-related protein [Nakamurella leprariae]MBM9467819.1 enoyl-CoA hydratase/isomerase family protein [Nakamurella leprariae]